MCRRFRKNSPKNSSGTVLIFAERRWDSPLPECRRQFPDTLGRSGNATRPPAGVTLLELLIALSIMVMVVGTLGGIARAVQMGFEYNQGHGAATQHARVALERITRTAREATANEQFPGFIVVAERVGTWRFPDTLVVWRPDGAAMNPDGLPRVNECVVYCPDPASPNRLLEITAPDDTRSVPPIADEAAWASALAAFKQSNTTRKVPLTDLLRTGAVDNAALDDLRGAVRFEVLRRPSDAQWADAGIPWEQLPWVQGIYGTKIGLRQSWVRIELELMTGEAPAAEAVDRRQGLPFFGSAALQYTMDEGQRP